MSQSLPSVVIHGHFYQPPREDPWWETVETQPSAEPHHDWNERVTAESYRAVVAARVPGTQGRIARIVNLLEKISFNFGPTLLEWMADRAPETYRAILEADALSRKALAGHGNAIAQAYHHTILPLASRREKVTEVRWGVSDFNRRFHRGPAGMWLPETAVDAETLDVLAQEGIAFTIVAPHQVETVPAGGLPGLFRTPGGRDIALFVYDGPLSHEVAFGPLLKDAEAWARAMAGESGEARPIRKAKGKALRLTSIATDGETYGHHHPFGEMALAAVLDLLENQYGARVENFASFLHRHPPVEEVTLVEPSSWSCTHGVERWKDDCGCKMDPALETQQEWRAPLRESVEWLATEIHSIYLDEGTPLLGDPWEARDRYLDTGRGEEALQAHGAEAGPSTDWSAPGGAQRQKALELLELERHALLLFTSCGWFFDDLAGIEPLQILRYAARAFELAGPHRAWLEAGFLDRLEGAVSNESPPRTGKDLFLDEAKPRLPAHFRVAGGAAFWKAVGSDDTPPAVPGYGWTPSGHDRFRIEHERTGRHWEVETRVERPSPGRISLSVREPEAGTDFVSVDLADIPEVFRERGLSALATSILSQEREPAPADGEAETRRCVWSALVGGVRALAEGAAPDLISHVRDLADLHTLMGLPIPFEAQTDYFRILENADGETRSALSQLREPLGFEPMP